MHIVFHRCKKSFLIIEMKLRHSITLQKTLRKQYYSIPLVLNRWSADRYRSALAFLPVRNNLFQFYTLKRRYQFRIKTVSKEY